MTFLLIILAIVYQRWQPQLERYDVAIVGLLGVIFVGNYLRLVLNLQLLGDYSLSTVSWQNWLLILYAIQLYWCYVTTRQKQSLSGYGSLFIYGGHGAAMAVPFHSFTNEFLVSLAWGVLAIACLLLALRLSNKTLGQSSLLVFGISAIKVFIFDLSETTSLVRIGCLVALGLSLYRGRLALQAN